MSKDDELMETMRRVNQGAVDLALQRIRRELEELEPALGECRNKRPVAGQMLTCEERHSSYRADPADVAGASICPVCQTRSNVKFAIEHLHDAIRYRRIPA